MESIFCNYLLKLIYKGVASASELNTNNWQLFYNASESNVKASRIIGSEQ